MNSLNELLFTKNEISFKPVLKTMVSLLLFEKKIFKLCDFISKIDTESYRQNILSLLSDDQGVSQIHSIYNGNMTQSQLLSTITYLTIDHKISNHNIFFDFSVIWAIMSKYYYLGIENYTISQDLLKLHHSKLNILTHIDTISEFESQECLATIDSLMESFIQTRFYKIQSQNHLHSTQSRKAA